MTSKATEVYGVPRPAGGIAPNITAASLTMSPNYDSSPLYHRRPESNLLCPSEQVLPPVLFRAETSGKIFVCCRNIMGNIAELGGLVAMLGIATKRPIIQVFLGGVPPRWLLQLCPKSVCKKQIFLLRHEQWLCLYLQGRFPCFQILHLLLPCRRAP